MKNNIYAEFQIKCGKHQTNQ